MRYVLCLSLLAAVARPAEAQTPLGTFAEHLTLASAITQLDDGRVVIATRQPGGLYAYSDMGDSLGILTSRPSSVRGMEQARAGHLLVLDGGQVERYDAQGNFLGTFASLGRVPIDLVELADGRVMVSQEGNTDDDGRVSIYAPDGTFLGLLFSDVDIVSSIAQLRDGRIVVLTAFDGARVYDPDGTLLAMWFISTFGDLIELEDGRLLVSDGDRLLIYEASFGGALGTFASGLQSATDLVQLADGRVLVTEAGTGRVLAYGVVPVIDEPGPQDESAVSVAYPLPVVAGREARIDLSLSAPGTVQVTVLDALGRVVASREAAVGNGAQAVSVPTLGLAPGVYVARLSGPGVRATRRLVVAR